jgi:polar amino acid transport system substrate-binding protein
MNISICHWDCAGRIGSAMSVFPKCLSSVSRRRAGWLAAGLVLAACGGGAPVGGLPPLRVGLDPTYPPFEMKDAAGRVTGVSADLAAGLAAHLGRPLELVPMDFQGLLPALKTGKIDAIISSMTRTDERARQVDFSDPYVENGLCLLIAAGSPVTGAADLDAPGRTLVVRTGTTGHLYAREHIRQARLIPQELVEACVAEVVNGNADAFLYDQLSVLEYAERNPDKTRADLRPFRREGWAIAFPKGSPELVAEANGFLRGFRASGGFDGLVAKYPQLEKRAAQLAAQGQPFVFGVREAGE